MRVLKKLILLFLVTILLINIIYLKKSKILNFLKFKNKIRESNNLKSYNENKNTDNLINQTLKVDIEKSSNELNIQLKNSSFPHDWLIRQALTSKPNYESTTATEETTTQLTKNTNYSTFPHDWNIILSPDKELCGNDPNKMRL